MRPPRFQLHLTTCIVLMFVAGGLLWANMRPREIFDGTLESGGLMSVVGSSRGMSSHTERLVHNEWGWPASANAEPTFFEQVQQDDELEEEIAAAMAGKNYIPTRPVQAPSHWRPKGLAINIATALAILLAVAVLSEWLLRHRKRNVVRPTT